MAKKKLRINLYFGAETCCLAQPFNSKIVQTTPEK